MSQDDTDARVYVKHTDMPNANGSDITAGNSYHTTKRVTTNTNANSHTTTHNTNAACATYAIDDTASGTRRVHTACTMTANNVNAIVRNDNNTSMAACTTEISHTHINDESHCDTWYAVVTNDGTSVSAIVRNSTNRAMTTSRVCHSMGAYNM